METLKTASSLLVSLACVVLLIIVTKAINWIWLRPKKLERWLRQQGIPGTSYKILYGDLKEMSSMRTQAIKETIGGFSNDYFSHVQPFHHQLITKLGTKGGTYFTWSGPRPVVHISRPELIREVLAKMHEFQKMHISPIVNKLFPGLVNHEGEKWTKHRKLINPAFHVEKLKLMLPAFRDSCNDMIDKWEKIVAEKGYSELDVWPFVKQLSADGISRAAFGSNYVEGQRIFELLQEQTAITLCLMQSIYIPGWRYLPTATNRRINQIEDHIHTLLTGIIDKRKMAVDAGEEAKDDLLGILLESNSKEIQAENTNQQSGLTIREVIDECKLFYFAGQETTSSLLVWTLILLSKHQTWQVRAQEEVLRTFGNNVPHYEGLINLKTVTMILYEVLRLYSPAMLLARRVYKDTKIGDLSLPAGALISLSVYKPHRSKELWGDDADEFRPERFSEGISKATKGNISFFPFGGGPRICIGEKFAILEAKMALSMILQRFSFELSPSYVHAPMPIIFLEPQFGAQLILHRITKDQECKDAFMME